MSNEKLIKNFRVDSERDKKKFMHIQGSAIVSNPPGIISVELIDKIRE